MFRTILVPLDGSTFSEQALPVATAIARTTGARIYLVQVHQPDHLRTFFSSERSDLQDFNGEREALEGLANELALIGLTVEAQLLDGSVVETLVAYASVVHADLVVAATHGRSNFTQTFLGSVAQALVRRLKTPTLLVRAYPNWPDSARPLPVRRLLVALDGTPESEEMLKIAVDLGRAMNSSFTLARIVEPVVFYDVGERDLLLPCHDVEATRRMMHHARTYLERISEPLRAEGLNVEVKVLAQPDAALAILETAHECGCDVIALESRGRHGLDRLLLGSVTDEVVRQSVGPVLTRTANPRGANGSS